MASNHIVGLVVRVGVAVVVAAVTLLAVPVTSGKPSAPVTSKLITVSAAGRSFPARLVYPTRGGSYPAVAFAHGYRIDSSYYRGTLRTLAAAGYVVIAPDSETGQFPSHGRFADDLNRSLQWLGRRSVAGSRAVPRGKVDPRHLGVAGHSMGGGVAILAAARSRSIDTIATLAAAETMPRASEAVRRLRVPSLFVVGSDDRIIPAASTTVMFRRAPSPSVLASITGGSHCGFMETIPLTCDAGRISYGHQLDLTRDQLHRWFDKHLRGRKAVRVTGLPGIRYLKD